MTITYQYRVANTTLGGFVKLLGMWKGSVYKLVYKEIIIFSCLYAAISLTYRLALNEEQRVVFESIVLHCNNFTSLIPVSFVLGFYVTMVIGRWWQQFINVPWPDRTLYLMCCYLQGKEEKPRILRRTVARYMLFGLILICRSISVAVMKRFPTLDHIVEAGFITSEEAMLYEKVDCKYNKFWVPLMWANAVLSHARREGHIKTDWGLRMVIESIADFRDRCSLCFVYDWITIPLVYTQVVTLAVHTFFLTCLIARQFLDPAKRYPNYEYDMYVPVFTLLEFFFYMGWLKVAEQLINPFGEDDDDYDINWLLDRHWAVAVTLVDEMCGDFPPLIKDLHFDEGATDLPYTNASLASKKPIFLGSSYNLTCPPLHDQRIIHPDEMVDYNDNRHSVFHRIGNSFAGSMLSLVTGRQSYSQSNYGDQLSVPSEHYSANLNQHMDHLHYTGDQTKTRTHSVIGSTNKPRRKISFEVSDARRGSAWSSDTRLNKPDSDWEARARANTTGNDPEDVPVDKTERKRKRSFPLSFLFKLADSRKNSSSSLGSSKTVKLRDCNEVEQDSTPEYVPLRRATTIGPLAKNKSVDNKINERRRKKSAPLSFVWNQFENDMVKNNSMDSLPTKLDSPATRHKASRFTIEQVSDDVPLDEELTLVHHRNAQKIKDSMSGKNISRAPNLSAIEEGGTITSITQILPEDEVPQTPDVIEEELEEDVPTEIHVDDNKNSEETTPLLNRPIPSIVIEEW
ncbi:bestrophin-3-like isoform X2 [Ostrea edulis]|uniref:bestrophin-3-like isoform X2 n=1 Tax=Ostrea edulis TaxID=37623 RepID=UPI0024AFAC65|nr:bestrophin-3-like isoform X2 [Ostrea edulis]XP_056011447.1 bestrophin-3-like isoform X2 [Ostrea edulis]